MYFGFCAIISASPSRQVATTTTTDVATRLGAGGRGTLGTPPLGEGKANGSANEWDVGTAARAACGARGKWCICSIYFLSSVTHYHYCFTFFHRHFYHLSLSLSLILIFLHRNEEGKRQHAVERGGAAAMEAGKKIVAYSFPYFNYVTHCVLSLA